MIYDVYISEDDSSTEADARVCELSDEDVVAIDRKCKESNLFCSIQIARLAKLQDVLDQIDTIIQSRE